MLPRRLWRECEDVYDTPTDTSGFSTLRENWFPRNVENDPQSTFWSSRRLVSRLGPDYHNASPMLCRLSVGVGKAACGDITCLLGEVRGQLQWWWHPKYEQTRCAKQNLMDWLISDMLRGVGRKCELCTLGCGGMSGVSWNRTQHEEEGQALSRAKVALHELSLLVKHGGGDGKGVTTRYVRENLSMVRREALQAFFWHRWATMNWWQIVSHIEIAPINTVFDAIRVT